MENGMLWNEKAVSPVLGAVLMLAIGVTILTTVQLNFVPVWNAQEELDHMKKMYDDFKDLKSGIESGVQSGTTLSKPLSMGFKYSPKMFVYNPRESAFATLDIRDNVWAEVRYNEMLPDGMDDAASIRNLTSSTITYSLQGAQNYNAFIYEQGLIRRSGSNYTSGSQMVLANDTIYLLSVKPLGSESTSSVEKQTVNIYPTSQQKNSVMGKNVWLILHTKPEYVSWWRSSIANEGGGIRKADNVTGIIIAYMDTAVIKMGEAYLTTAPKTAPARAAPYRIVKVTPENTYLPVDGTTTLTVEVQDYYNNPVPNVQVNFNINYSRKPGNANATANLLQNSAVSGADGRGNVMLETRGAGFYYIDASMNGNTTTFVYPASSQGNVLKLYKAPSGQDYLITANLTDVFGNPINNIWISFDTSDGTVTPPLAQTSVGNATTTLNVSSATGIKLTNINSRNTTLNSTIITWDAINNITVSAQSGYVFNSIEVPTLVNSTGCVRYGTSPGNYSSLICDPNVTASSHSVNLGGLQPSTAYYFEVNSSRGAVNVISTEYMFVTGAPQDSTPPASITSLNYISGPLYINWTWTDPADADFHHVELYVDSNPGTTVPKGQGYYNAFYFRPNSTHTINVRTVDTSGNANATWVNNTAYTPSVFTYVFNYSITNGSVTNFNNAKNDSDSGASATFNEENTAGTPDTHNYTYVTGNTTTVGNISNWINMQSNTSAYATLIEGGSTVSVNTSYYATSSPTGHTNVLGAPNNILDSINNNRITGSGFAAGGSGTITKVVLKYYYSITSYDVSDVPTIGYTLNSVDTTVKTETSNIPYNYPNPTYIIDITSVRGIWTWADVQSLSLWLNVAKSGSPGSTANVDAFEVNVTTSATSYSMNITTDTSSVPSGYDSYYLEVNYSRNANETGYNVSVFNGTAWNNRGIMTSLAWTVFNYTLNVQEYNGGNPRIRYIDQTPGGITQGNLYIDYQRIHAFKAGTPAGYHLDITTNTTDIPEASASVLQLKYTVSGDNFTVQIMNGTTSGWDNPTTLNTTGMPYRNITLTSDELLQEGTFSGNVPYVPSINKYYVLVRYLDQSPGANGTLSLDYQRVYSW